MKRKLFNDTSKQITQTGKLKKDDLEKLVDIQARLLVEQYQCVCFDVKQLKAILGIGETYVYRLLKSGNLPCQTIGKRKIVGVAALAQFIISGKEKSA